MTLQERPEKKPALSWSQISVKIINKINRSSDEKPTNLLTNVSGIAQVGEILAVMGTSGVGKTTLMNVLSGRQGRALPTTGQVYLNGCSTTAIQRITSGKIGYVEQNAVFIDTMTLEEHLIFQAMLRMRRIVSDFDRRVRVKDIISQLHLNKSISTTIGRLSGGEKKRLTFASVLLTEPNVILIDEPTSGLDTYLAKSLMSMIRSMAVEQNHAVIVVLHQPTSSMFDLLDTLCLLVQDGRQAFFGTKEEAEKFFISKCHLSAPSLDGFIEQLAAPADSDNRHDIAQVIAAEQYAKSEEAHSLHTTIERNLDGNGKNAEIPTDDVRGASFGRQLKWLLWRSMADGKRNPARTTRLFLRMIIMGFIVGFVFFGLRPSSSDYVQNVRALVFAILLGLFDLNMSLVALGLLSERALVIREYKQRIYSLRAYYLNRLLIDLCYIVVICVLYTSIIVLLTNLHRPLLLITIVTLSVMTACAIAAFIATLSPTPQVALLILNPLQQLLCTISGIYISIRSIPLYLRWFKYLSYWFYGFNLLLILQWHLINTHLPCNRTCFPDIVSNSTRNNTNICTRVGDDVLLYEFGIAYQDYGRDIAMLIILIAAFHLTTFLCLVFKIRRAM